jgi:hypothetical protein
MESGRHFQLALVCPTINRGGGSVPDAFAASMGQERESAKSPHRGEPSSER